MLNVVWTFTIWKIWKESNGGIFKHKEVNMQTLIENIIISSFKFIMVKIKICYFFILSTSFGNDLYGIYLLCSPLGYLFICELEST